MIILGIDPGSLKTGWALIHISGKKIKYINSGVLAFDGKTDFLERLTEIKIKVRGLIQETTPDEVALESLIYVKSPTALMKLAQTRGIILSELVEKLEKKIFEYSPNLVKSSTVGHGHATKESVQKFLDMMTGQRDYKTHDESDALAIAICHALNRTSSIESSNVISSTRRKPRSLKDSLAHKLG